MEYLRAHTVGYQFVLSEPGESAEMQHSAADLLDRGPRRRRT